ncbi:TetR/AcrR family transcriptional regulator [Desulfoscipio gibsoniae]|uniref:Transcriptional regulator n=1 Tax=Desulfoscipio gibsoniae DSM 7213 TaxID=767817 RepID=R4KJK9_9FIRM|nr:TetR/AcrR family transcriptional regulator [Desulfoscipio gibsoniae]AGK99815.1 transcriptional regulator [Desulfoscipio gibsoniae DSM 7213]
MTIETKPKGRWERRKEQTRDTIISTALELFGKQGIESTSMEQIAEESDIAKATLYKYFPNKEAIAAAYMQEAVREKMAEMDRLITENADTRSRLLALLTMISEWNEENRDIVKLHASARFQDLLSGHIDNNRLSGFEYALTRIFKVGQDNGELRQDLSAQKLALYYKAMYLVPFGGWLLDQGSSDLESSLAESVDLFLGGARQH